MHLKFFINFLQKRVDEKGVLYTGHDLVNCGCWSEVRSEHLYLNNVVMLVTTYVISALEKVMQNHRGSQCWFFQHTRRLRRKLYRHDKYPLYGQGEKHVITKKKAYHNTTVVQDWLMVSLFQTIFFFILLSDSTR